MASLSPLAQQLIREAQREPLPTREEFERAHARFARATGASPVNAELVLKKLLTLLAVGALFVGAPSSSPGSLQSGPASSGPLRYEAVRPVPPASSARGLATDNEIERPASGPASDHATPLRPAAPAPSPLASHTGAASRSQPSAEGDSLRRELAALNAARRSASAARYSEASQALASVEFRQLGLERDALQLWLRCQQSDPAAVAAARRFLARHASHPMFSKVREACLPSTARTTPGQPEPPKKAKDVRR